MPTPSKPTGTKLKPIETQRWQDDGGDVLPRSHDPAPPEDPKADQAAKAAPVEPEDREPQNHPGGSLDEPVAPDGAKKRRKPN
jgi:hypothetical protein